MDYANILSAGTLKRIVQCTGFTLNSFDCIFKGFIISPEKYEICVINFRDCQTFMYVK